MIHQRWAKFIVTAFVLFALGAVSANDRVTSETRDLQEPVASATDTIAVKVEYEFVNSVSIDKVQVTDGLTIKGADIFDSVDGGDITYSFATDDTELFAEIIQVDGVAVSETDDPLGNWFQDGDNYLEFGIGPPSLLDDNPEASYDALSKGDLARLFPAFEASEDPTEAKIGPVRLDAQGTTTGIASAFVFEDFGQGTTTANLNPGGGGQRTEQFAYYIAQRGDGPELGFNEDEDSDEPMSVTVQFTVAPQ